MHLNIIVELRCEFGVAFLITIRIHIRAEGIEHPVIRALDTARITGAEGYRLFQFAERLGGIAHVRSRERIEVGLAGDGVRALPVAKAVGVFAPQTELD